MLWGVGSWRNHGPRIQTMDWGRTSGGVHDLVFTCTPGKSYHRQLWSLLLYLCYIFQVQINSLVGWSCSGECTAGTHEAETEVISGSFIQDHQVKQRKERRSGRDGKGKPYQFDKGLETKWHNKDLTVSLKVYWWTDTEEKLVTPLCGCGLPTGNPHKNTSCMLFSIDISILEKGKRLQLTFWKHTINMGQHSVTLFA